MEPYPSGASSLLVRGGAQSKKIKPITSQKKHVRECSQHQALKQKASQLQRPILPTNF